MKAEKTVIIDERNAQIESQLLEKLDWIPRESVPDTQRSIALSLIKNNTQYYLKDQFNEQGDIHAPLLSTLRSLQQYGNLFAIDWLYREKRVLLERARATHQEFQQALDRGANIELEIAQIESSQSTYITATPMSLIIENQIDLFRTFFDDWYLNDARKIPTVEINWFDAWLDMKDRAP
ncbi:hypothetical protein L9W76_03825 [Vibrio aestuarianus]|uniref:hypothetical protein n=1 Tax=Vibrio aestuarianus TaxID=28171 RepID=UPI0021C3BDC5|nr:hypothetical protein [Vibrio aestuarianus]MDE1252314.1 hypothetical protein [Vibrio aestuarianus]CAH8191065.1 conserved hypothetical protein [Vibrio aestuarianus]